MKEGTDGHKSGVEENKIRGTELMSEREKVRKDSELIH